MLFGINLLKGYQVSFLIQLSYLSKKIPKTSNIDFIKLKFYIVEKKLQ
jgi:hypothetical protein